MLELDTEKEGCMSYTTTEDAQRPRAVYDIHPDFLQSLFTLNNLSRDSPRFFHNFDLIIYSR